MHCPASTEAAFTPSSWQEDLLSYRACRGSQQYSVVDTTTLPKRFARTTLCPFGGTRNGQYSSGDSVGPGKRVSPVDEERFRRHGWVGSHLLPQQYSQCAAVQSSRAHATRSSRGQENSSVIGPVGGLPGAPTVDAWLGNQLMDPNKGRKHALPPKDPKGRKDMFQVINQSHPSAPSDDSWMGNVMVDPSKGKAAALSPERRMGRADLFEILQQTAASSATRVDGRGSDDALTDAWIGNIQIHPAKGKGALPEAKSKQDHLLGSVITTSTCDGQRCPRVPTSRHVGPVARLGAHPGLQRGSGMDPRFSKGKRILKPGTGATLLEGGASKQTWSAADDTCLKLLGRAPSEGLSRPWK